MRARLLALATLVVSLGAGVVVFVNWDTGEVDRTIDNFGAFEVMDRASCSTAACNTAQCVQAQNILADAGSPCVPRFVDCDFRVGQRVRNLAVDAGAQLGPQKYQRLRLVALRCPAADGGNAFGVPFDDNGWPIYAVATATPRCVRAPLDGGLNCRRVLPDGGTRFFGTGNVMPAAEATGAQCEAVGCSVMFGDNPDTDL